MTNQMTPGEFNTDKGVSFLHNYSEVFAEYADSEVRLLELGVLHGGSLDLWAKYFSKGTIVGVDINQVEVNQHNGRVRFFQGDQSDVALLRNVRNLTAPDGFDIIIDDGSHFARHTENSFLHLYMEALKPGGIYVIEDWGTGYWNKWPDGKDLNLTNGHIITKLRSGTNLPKATEPTEISYQSHEYGMVGLIKQLIDEVAIRDVTKQGMTSNHPLTPLIDKVMIVTGQVFIFKPL